MMAPSVTSVSSVPQGMAPPSVTCLNLGSLMADRATCLNLGSLMADRETCLNLGSNRLICPSLGTLMADRETCLNLHTGSLTAVDFLMASGVVDCKRRSDDCLANIYRRS